MEKINEMENFAARCPFSSFLLNSFWEFSGVHKKWIIIDLNKVEKVFNECWLKK
jgi:hypothetical protein